MVKDKSKSSQKDNDEYIVLPKETFSKLMAVIISLPYSQVAGIVNEVNKNIKEGRSSGLV